MTKYDGIRKVETVLGESGSVEKRKRGAGDLIFRLLAAAFITAVPFGLKAVGGNYAEKAVDAVKAAVSYDIIEGERVDNAEIAFLELIKEREREKDGDKE